MNGIIFRLWIINLKDFSFKNSLKKGIYLLRHEVKRVHSKF